MSKVHDCTLLYYYTIWLYRDFALSFCLEKFWCTGVCVCFPSTWLQYIYALTPLHDAAGNAILGAVNFENGN